jgi:enoyl-CoA hydratase/carnithine racemase
MKPEWQADILALADQLQADQAALKGVLLTSAKTTFFAGADLKGVLKLQASDAAAGFLGIEAVKRAFRRIETMGKPVVALLQGAALGGGWEIALIAHARFALDQPKILFGLPEVTLGLSPGATGITKMTRLLGLMAAQPYLMEGKLFNPSEALSLGLVDGLASSPEQLMDLALAYIHDNPQVQQPWIGCDLLKSEKMKHRAWHQCNASFSLSWGWVSNRRQKAPWMGLFRRGVFALLRPGFGRCNALQVTRLSISMPTLPAAISRKAVTPGLFLLSMRAVWPWFNMRAR